MDGDNSDIRDTSEKYELPYVEITDEHRRRVADWPELTEHQLAVLASALGPALEQWREQQRRQRDDQT